MIPKWAYKLMVRNRTSSAREHDEHGNLVDEHHDEGGYPLTDPDLELASPGYGDLARIRKQREDNLDK